VRGARVIIIFFQRGDYTFWFPPPIHPPVPRHFILADDAYITRNGQRGIRKRKNRKDLAERA